MSDRDEIIARLRAMRNKCCDEAADLLEADRGKDERIARLIRDCAEADGHIAEIATERDELQQKLSRTALDALAIDGQADELSLENATLRAELASAREDAERYRWLRDSAPDTLCAIAWRVRAACEHGEPDAAVDAARGGK